MRTKVRSIDIPPDAVIPEALSQNLQKGNGTATRLWDMAIMAVTVR